MKNKLYEEYASLDMQIKQLEEKKKVLRDQVVQDLATNELKKLETEVGTFSFVERKSFVFDDFAKNAIADAKKNVKRVEKFMIDQGKGQEEVQSSLRFVSKER